MIPGINHVYYEYGRAGARLVASAQDFALECKESATAETGSVPAETEDAIAQMELICKAVESSFLRGDSAYDIASVRDVVEELRESNNRLQGHMPGRYVRENDPCKDRYKHGTNAMATMNDLYESALELLRYERQVSAPKHIKAASVEMCWHIRTLFELGTGVVVGAWRYRQN